MFYAYPHVFYNSAFRAPSRCRRRAAAGGGPGLRRPMPGQWQAVLPVHGASRPGEGVGLGDDILCARRQRERLQAHAGCGTCFGCLINADLCKEVVLQRAHGLVAHPFILPLLQEAWECRSRLARTLILRRCLVQFRCGRWQRWGAAVLGVRLRRCCMERGVEHLPMAHADVAGPQTCPACAPTGRCRNGVSAWLRMAMLCLLCLLGLWGNHTSLHRPALDAHAARRAEQRRKRLLKRTQATLLKMRTNAAAGQHVLDSGGRGGDAGGDTAGAAQEPPDPHEPQRRRSRSSGSGGSGGTEDDVLGATLQAVAAAAVTGGSPTAAAGAAAGEGCSPSQQADQAYACFLQAVRLLEVRPWASESYWLGWGGSCS